MEASAGGSSGGSAAAVAADFCDVALGTDTIGSVRIPAAYCGVVGHKPQRGAIATEGVVPLSPTLDTVGVLGRDVSDCRLVSAVLAEGRPPPSIPDRPLRVAVADWAAMAKVDLPVANAFEHMIGSASRWQVEIVPIALSAIEVKALQRLLLVIAEIEGAAVHHHMMAERPEGFSPVFSRMLSWGAQQSDARRVQALGDLAVQATAIEQALAGCDALLYPPTPHTAFTAGLAVPDNQAVFSAIAATTGWPATCFPIGSGTGRPIASEVMSRDAAIGFALAALLTRSGG
jgi:aspartyl-tRNA(Asn)/glutamyl-tRNA(Gln) amidotransferase subunit A